LWLDEGIACSQEKITLDERLRVARNLVAQAKFSSLNRLPGIKGGNGIEPEDGRKHRQEADRADLV
jgi:hypothetical protein